MVGVRFLTFVRNDMPRTLRLSFRPKGEISVKALVHLRRFLTFVRNDMPRTLSLSFRPKGEISAKRATRQARNADFRYIVYD